MLVKSVLYSYKDQYLGHVSFVFFLPKRKKKNYAAVLDMHFVIISGISMVKLKILCRCLINTQVMELVVQLIVLIRLKGEGETLNNCLCQDSYENLRWRKVII